MKKIISIILIVVMMIGLSCTAEKMFEGTINEIGKNKTECTLRIYQDKDYNMNVGKKLGNYYIEFDVETKIKENKNIIFFILIPNYYSKIIYANRESKLTEVDKLYKEYGNINYVEVKCWNAYGDSQEFYIKEEAPANNLMYRTMYFGFFLCDETDFYTYLYLADLYINNKNIENEYKNLNITKYDIDMYSTIVLTPTNIPTIHNSKYGLSIEISEVVADYNWTKSNQITVYLAGKVLKGENDYEYMTIKVQDDEGYIIHTESIILGKYSEGDRFKYSKHTLYLDCALWTGKEYNIIVE